MPLWKIYHPEGSFSVEDKTSISERITEIYRNLPKFYVGVVFQEVPRSSFFIGGEAADDFVRIWVDHIARQFRDEELKEKFLGAVNHALSPYISDRGLRWEMHVDETPFSLWLIQGFARHCRPRTPKNAGAPRIVRPLIDQTVLLHHIGGSREAPARRDAVTAQCQATFRRYQRVLESCSSQFLELTRTQDCEAAEFALPRRPSPSCNR